LYSPYSTASASKAKSNDIGQVLEEAEEEERHDHDWQVCRHEEDPGAHHDETCSADEEGVLLADSGDYLGTTGTATNVEMDVARTIQISWLELPRI
jgi:hypothetical protein